jgi:hypothetical protein
MLLLLLKEKTFLEAIEKSGLPGVSAMMYALPVNVGLDGGHSDRMALVTMAVMLQAAKMVGQVTQLRSPRAGYCELPADEWHGSHRS